MGDLGIDTQIQGEGGQYRARLSRDWEIWGPNGGYLGVIALRAAGAATTLRRPASFLCHYLNVAEFGDVDLVVQTMRASRRVAAMRVSMTQAQRPILEALVWVIDEQSPGLEHNVASMPDVPSPAALKSYEDLKPEGYPWYPFWNNVETRPTRWAESRSPGPPEWLAWHRLRPVATFADPFVDAGRALLYLDTFTWPAAGSAHEFPTPFVAPNIDLAVQFHQRASDCEWLLCHARAPVATGGLIGCQSQVWSQGGQLLATGSCQLFCRPNPMLAAAQR